MQDKKLGPSNTGDCLKEVTLWAGFTIYVNHNIIPVLLFYSFIKMKLN
jgi:hypothetical protein